MGLQKVDPRARKDAKTGDPHCPGHKKVTPGHKKVPRGGRFDSQCLCVDGVEAHRALDETVDAQLVVHYHPAGALEGRYNIREKINIA